MTSDARPAPPLRDVKFLLSAPALKLLPPPDLPEYAFAGRSNVGKSSLLNYLCGEDRMFARVSSTPGKTQLLNVYEVGGIWRLIDMPGYGYAKVSQTQRQAFGKLLRDYVARRESLMTVFILVDARHPLQTLDREFMTYATEVGAPFAVVFTKLDKLRAMERNSLAARYGAQLAEYFDPVPPFIFTSAQSKTGRDELLDYVRQANAHFDNAPPA